MKYKIAHLEPLPCPRCGTHPIIIKTVDSNRFDGESYSVCCVECGVEYPKIPYLTLKSAIFFWNTKYADANGGYWRGIGGITGKLDCELDMCFEIKACPICGGEPEIVENNSINTVICSHCGIAHPTLRNISVKDAVDCWNDDASYWWLNEDERNELLGDKLVKNRSNSVLNKFRGVVGGLK